MSDQITTAQVKQFTSNVIHLVQQNGSRLRNTVDYSDIVGEAKFFEQIGATDPVRITSRHQDTPRVDTPHERRQVTTDGWVWADLIDGHDRIRTLIDPTSDYNVNAVKSLGRKIDDIVIEAATGTAKTGKDGTTEVSLDSNMIVDVQTVWPGTSAADAGLNAAKITEAYERLCSNDVDTDEEFYMVVTAKDIKSLLRDEKVASSDYNTIKPLYQGKMGYYGGFNLIHCERIKTDANSDNKVLYYCKSGIRLGFGKDIETKVSERADKNYATQVWAKLDCGGTRMEETKVGYVECDPTSGPTGA